jgi:hypothetical protein
MSHDIEVISQNVRSSFPDVVIEKLKVSHPGVDDDGLWFFSLLGHKKTIQIESSTYLCPFIIEHSDMKSSGEAITASTVEHVVREISSYLARIDRGE